ncbi:MAG: hypothetical protein M1829_006757 [Trizodia sp. TS-e1964]|nr:MAG: hypothetical protein M1829_006757 [Trizodia sp. TS-e1964]
MRNLTITKNNIFGAKSTDIPDNPLTAIAWDSSNDDIICAFGPDKDSSLLELKRFSGDGQSSASASTGSKFTSIASWDAPSPRPDLAIEKILSLQYFSDSLTSCLVMAGGDIIRVLDNALPGEDKIEITGSVDVGIAAAVWSPDEELLLILTEANTILYMTREFENTMSVEIAAVDLTLPMQVSVGWGKKETQFKGKRAKALRDPTIPENIDRGALSPFDQGKASISWRGDGAFVAVSTIEANIRRVIRVYSREGALDSVSEPLDGLEGSLSWRPAGNLMAGIKRQENRLEVIFFERNGLRHGQFDLRLLPEQIEQNKDIGLWWNADSTVLAVRLQDKIQFWTMGNYHYYLKYEYYFSGAQYFDATSFIWHREKALKGVIFNREEMHLLELGFSVARGSTLPPYDFGTVAVIDGKTVKLTPLRLANIPPPMALHEIVLESAVVDISLNQDGSQIAVLTRTKDLLSVASLNLSTDALTIFPSIDGNTVCTKSANGTISELGLENESSQIVFGLTVEGSLYAGTRLLANNCTSFVVTQAHLIFTTTQHLLKFVHMASIEGKSRKSLRAIRLKLSKGDLEVPSDDPELDERCRSIERGAKLVTTMPTSFSVVLQMPRGNLETIYPRALVLAGIRRSIRAKDYKSAFMACRSQRVDLNILHDYAPNEFMSSVELFVDQIKAVEHIDLFLSHLRDENVTQTMYKETLAKHAHDPLLDIKSADLVSANPKASTKASKINRICDAFLVVISSRKSTNLQNLVTAHVCKSPPDLEAGLLVIAKLRDSNELVERAVEHICFLADVNSLYKTALGMYNLNLALLVAQQSQMDPREYLPFLQNLQELPLLRRKFSIDDHLGLYKKALAHLHSLTAFTEVKTYVLKNTLYKEALGLYKYDAESLGEIMKLYATYLESKSQHKEAGIAYEYLKDYKEAMDSYRAAGLWRESLFCASLAALTPDEIAELALGLADGLYEGREYFQAATVHKDYRGDVEAAVRIFCKGYHFADAMRLAIIKDRRDLLDSTFNRGLLDAMASSTELLADCKGQLNAQVPRLRELRLKKEEDPLGFLDPDSTDVPDNISLAGTTTSTSASLFTRYTGHNTATVNSSATRRTSKNRRREERKRARGKKGSVYEEEYLVNSIERLLEKVNSVRDEIARLVEALLRRAMRERALAVETAMAEVVNMCSDCLDEVFGVEEKVALEGQEREPRVGGGGGVLLESLEERGRERPRPIVKPLERLALLEG